MVEDALVQGGRPRQHRHPLPGHALEHTIDVEDRFREHGGAGAHRGQDPGLQAEHVEVGVDHQVAVLGAQTGHGHPVRGHPERAGVGLHHALGDSGGARREQDVRAVIGAQGGGAPVDLRLAGLGGAAQERRPRLGARGGRTIGHHDGGEVREVRRVVRQQGHVVGAEEIGDRHQGPRPAPRQDGGGLGAFEARVHRHDRGPRLEQAEEGHDPLDAVGGPDRHAVAGLDAGRDQGGAEPAALPGQLGVGEAVVPVRDRQPVAEAVDRGREHRRDGVAPPVAAGRHPRRTASSTFMRRARLAPMILRTDSSGSPSSSSM